MSNDDRGVPEQELFLWSAMRSMEKYHRQHGQYADRWPLLDIQFKWPASWTGAPPELRPSEGTGATWRPLNCKSNYLIKRATTDTFLVQSLNDQGEVEYEIEQGMTKARWVRVDARAIAASQQEMSMRHLDTTLYDLEFVDMLDGIGVNARYRLRSVGAKGCDRIHPDYEVLLSPSDFCIRRFQVARWCEP